ncbi:MAG: hypothetical protein V7735_19425, partial [Photobacterium frigidiphilum]|uniref:hypothetical protein n=1 Tax=Photobacterium frigidiphilum TaxID=264736 RepID=UPI003002B7FA
VISRHSSYNEILMIELVISHIYPYCYAEALSLSVITIYPSYLKMQNSGFCRILELECRTSDE